MNRDITLAQVWELVRQGCNVAEVAAWVGISVSAAQAMMCRAARDYANAPRIAPEAAQ